MKISKAFNTHHKEFLRFSGCIPPSNSIPYIELLASDKLLEPPLNALIMEDSASTAAKSLMPTGPI